MLSAISLRPLANETVGPGSHFLYAPLVVARQSGLSSLRSLARTVLIAAEAIGWCGDSMGLSSKNSPVYRIASRPNLGNILIESSYRPHRCTIVRLICNQ